MTTRKQQTASRFTDLEVEVADVRQVGEARAPEDDALGQVSDEELQAEARSRGMVVQGRRRSRRVIDRNEDVKGKSRITVHLPTELRIAMETARSQVNASYSLMMEEAMIDWFAKRRLRLPAFETTWDK